MEKSGQRVARLAAFRLGTRASRLAMAQSQMMADAIMAAHPGVTVELITIRTSGDRITDRPLADLGGKGLFTKELEQALLAGQIDFAVHSYKDVPVTMPLVDVSELIIAAVPKREDPRDVLIGPVRSIEDLPEGAKVGTGSLRRKCQLLDRRPDLVIESIRGNIDTRLRKQREGQYDAILLAMAGIKRAEMFEEKWMTPLHLDGMLPAPAQGALALQCRRNDAPTIELLRAMNDEPTAACVDVEREFVREMNGDCHSPIAAYAEWIGNEMQLRVAIGATDGALPVTRALVRGQDLAKRAALTLK